MTDPHKLYCQEGGMENIIKASRALGCNITACRFCGNIRIRKPKKKMKDSTLSLIALVLKKIRDWKR